MPHVAVSADELLLLLMEARIAPPPRSAAQHASAITDLQTCAMLAHRASFGS